MSNGFLTQRTERSGGGLRAGILALLLLLCVGVAILSPALAAETAGSTEETFRAWWAEVKELYEKAKAAGDQVPADATEWFRAEVKKIGTWEYRVVEVQDTFAAELEARLNERGKERWQVFWMERDGKLLRIYLKRPVKSYLKAVPARDLLRLVPTGTSAPAN